MKRIGWDEYFMKFAYLVSERSTCHRKVGAVIVKDNLVVATGYNGAPKGLQHCSERGGCLRQKLSIPSGTHQEICRAVHAEQNAIIQAAVKGTSVKGSTIYVNIYPCSICARMLINAEIEKIVYDCNYEDNLAKELLAESKITVVKYQK